MASCSFGCCVVCFEHCATPRGDDAVRLFQCTFQRRARPFVQTLAGVRTAYTLVTGFDRGICSFVAPWSRKEVRLILSFLTFSSVCRASKDMLSPLVCAPVHRGQRCQRKRKTGLGLLLLFVHFAICNAHLRTTSMMAGMRTNSEQGSVRSEQPVAHSARCSAFGYPHVRSAGGKPDGGLVSTVSNAGQPCLQNRRLRRASGRQLRLDTTNDIHRCDFVPDLSCTTGPIDAASAKESSLGKRAGKGMDRHLFSSAAAASLALGTAVMGMSTYSIRLHDWKTYKAKKEKKPSSSPPKGEAKSKPSAKAEPASPGSPTFNNSVVVVNNFYNQPAPAAKPQRRSLKGEMALAVRRQRTPGQDVKGVTHRCRGCSTIHFDSRTRGSKRRAWPPSRQFGRKSIVDHAIGANAYSKTSLSSIGVEKVSGDGKCANKRG